MNNLVTIFLAVILVLNGCRDSVDLPRLQKMELRQIVVESNNYFIAKESFPSSIAELSGFSPEVHEVDQWGSQLVFYSDEKGVRVTSMGQDKILHTADDLNYRTSDEDH